MEMKHNDLKTLYCHKCGQSIKPGNSIIIDVNTCVYCCDLCLFEDYGLSYIDYLRREDKTSNYMDLGILDIKYSGTYDISVLGTLMNEGD